MFSREKIGVILAELFGTFILATVAIAAAGYFNFTAPWYVSIAVGLTLAGLVGIIGNVSGAHVNPAITIGMWTLKKIETMRAVVYITAQFMGGLLALAFVEYAASREIMEQSLNLDWSLFTAELVGAAVFGFGVAAAVMQKLEGAQKALTIGLSLMMGILIASVSSAGFINPAVAVANNTWDWTVVLAPILGVVLGMNVYSLFMAPKSSLKTSRTSNTKKK